VVRQHSQPFQAVEMLYVAFFCFAAGVQRLTLRIDGSKRQGDEGAALLLSECGF